MMIQNLDPDPHALKSRYNWGASIVRSEDGRHWKYVGTGNSYMGACTPSAETAAPVGNVIVLIAQTLDAVFETANIWRADELLNEQDGDTYIKAARITETGRHELRINQCTTGVTILGSGIYTPDDWDEILELHTSGVLQYPWISGETLRGASL